MDPEMRRWLESRFDRIEAKFDRTDELLAEMNRLQVRHSVILDEHHQRSTAITARVEQVAAEVAPLKAHVAAWGGVEKALTILGVLAAIVTALMKMLGR